MSLSTSVSCILTSFPRVLEISLPLGAYLPLIGINPNHKKCELERFSEIIEEIQ